MLFCGFLQLYDISNIHTNNRWPGMAYLPAYVEFNPQPRPPMRKYVCMSCSVRMKPTI